MPGFDGSGPAGMGPMTGGGRGFCGTGGAGRRNYGYPRWTSQARPRRRGYGTFAPQAGPEQELDFLKDQAEQLKRDLEQLEARIGELSASKSDERST